MIHLYKLINKLSLSVFEWSETKINSHEAVKRSKINNILACIGLVLFLIFSFMVYNTPFGKQLAPKHEKKIVKVESENDREYKFLKTHFTWLQRDVYNFIKYQCEKSDVDYMLIMSVIQFESGSYCGNKWEKMIVVKSYAGARGVMQIMPFHAPDPDDLWNWKYNVKKGIWYMRACLEASGGNIQDASRRYNQGIYGNPRTYRNWKYVWRISAKYKEVLTERVMVAQI